VAVKVTASDAQSGDRFGSSVAMSGDYAIVGAYLEDRGSGDPASNAGAAYVYHRTGAGAWSEGAKLVALDAQADDNFGGSVAISGDYAIAGARDEDGGSGDTASNAGAAYVYHRTGTNTWDAGTKLVASDARERDRFGDSVAISGDYAIVGAVAADAVDGDTGTNTGAAYVFRRTAANAWDAGAKVVAPDPHPIDLFGASVAISADYAIVGAGGDDGGTGDLRTDTGAAFVFHRTGANIWDGGTKLVAPDAQAGDEFGDAVAVCGDYAVVGASREDGGNGDLRPNAGAAYVYRRTEANTWEAVSKLVAPDAQEDAEFGGSVAVSGDYAIVGASLADGEDANSRLHAGGAYAY
jgi:hypothetical protein